MSESTHILSPRAYRERPWFTGLVFGLIAVLYLVNRSPYPGFDDGLGFLLDAETGFNLHTNATNHVLFNNLQHVLVSVFPFLPSAMVLTLFTNICALLCLWRLYRIGGLITGGGVAALVPVVVLGLSFTFWQQSEIIEVYAFNNLLFVHFLYFGIKDLLSGNRNNYLAVSLLLGLGLLTHIQNVLSIPFFLYYLWGNNGLSAGRKGLALLVAGTLFFLLFIPPLLGNMNTVSAVFFDRNFRGSVMGFDFVALLKGGAKAVAYFLYNFHVFILLILHGWYLLWKNHRRLFFILSLLLIPYLGFAVKYNVNDNHVFFLISYILLVIPTALSFAKLGARRSRQMNWVVPLMLVVSPLMYGAAATWGKKIEFVARYDAEKAYKGGVTHLLWPGRAGARDPLALAKIIYDRDPGAFDRGEIEWNYPAALALLRLKGEI